MARFAPRHGHGYGDDLSTPSSPPITTHPVPRILFHEDAFVAKAHRWAWAQQGPQGDVPNDGQNWPPRWPSKMQAVAAYWFFRINRKWYEGGKHPALLGIEQMVAYALDQAAIDIPEKPLW